MSTATKLTYLNETKSQLKDMINYGLPTENQITNETTFRNYVSSIFKAFIESLNNPSTLYSNLPKVSGNGTQISLNGVTNAPMRISLGASQLTQDSTPTPSTPQDIHTISGDNTIRVENKNLFKNISSTYTIHGITFDNNGERIKITGTVLDDYFPSIIYYADGSVAVNDWYVTSSAIKPQKGYFNNNNVANVISLNNTGTINSGGSVRIGIGRETIADLYNMETIENKTYSIASGKEKINFITIGIKASTTIDLEIKLQIEVGTTATSYEPHQEQTAQLNLPVENLVSSSTRVGNSLFFNGITIQENYTFEPGTYTLSYENSNSTQVYMRTATTDVTLLGYNSPKTFTATEKFNVWVYRSGMVDGETTNIQLESSTKANSYTPYGTTPIEYGAIGNYEDEFILTSGKNIFNPNVATSNCSVDTTTGIITITANSTDTYIKGAYVYTDANKFLTLPSGSYYIKSTNSKVRITLYSDGTSLDTITSQPATLSTTTNFGGLRIRSTDSSSLQNVSFGIMISTTDTPYEPYGAGQWYLKKNIGKVVFNGIESWSTNGETTDYGQYVTFLDDKAFGLTNLICDRFIVKQSSVDNCISGRTANTAIAVTIAKSIVPYNRDLFINWLSLNNVLVYYALATPTYILLNDTLQEQLDNIHEKLLSYKGTTNISQVNNDLPFTITSTALKDL